MTGSGMEREEKISAGVLTPGYAQGRFASARMVSSAMKERKPNKHEQKTLETRDLLMRSAETVFVRDGYEKADLGEIAELAGRTKGAIYAQFKSKEELFFALVELKALERRTVVRDLLGRSHSTECNLAAFRKVFIESARDEQWGLLLLEFQLYTTRHPDVRERLADLYRSIVPDDEESAYSAILGPAADKGRHPIDRAVATHAAFGMLSGLQVQARFRPEIVDQESVKQIAGRLFDALFGPAKK